MVAKGRGQQKGAAFEREVCDKLSRWVSRDQKKDLFWRTAMSGGRATVGRARGDRLTRHAGDICSTSPEGHSLTNLFYLECKFYRSLSVQGFFIDARGKLAEFWLKTCEEAQDHDKEPMLIAKENRTPTLVITKPNTIERICLDLIQPCILVSHVKYDCQVMLFDKLLQGKYRIPRVRI